MPRFIDIDMQQLKDLRLRGWDIKTLAAFFGCGQSTIWTRLQSINLTDRRQGAIEAEAEEKVKVERWRLAMPW